MHARGKFSVALIVLVAFVSGVLFTTAGASFFGAEEHVAAPSAASAPSAYTVPPAAVAPALSLEEAFVSVAEVINPMVVQIRSERVVENRLNPFEEYFGVPNEDREYRSQALGSGVITRSDGYIITNNHVISDAEELEVELFDGQTFKARSIGTDPQSDLAVIKIEANALPAIAFGRIEEVRVGQWVMAFGSPLAQELGNSVTAGIVSAIGRTSSNLSRYNFFSSFIQTDAAINPGNSGGPLVNLQGELVGINSMIYSQSGGYQGIGFSIPADVVKNVVDQLIDTGTVERGYLGVGFDAVSPSLAEALGVPRGAAQVTSVQDGSAADRAGVEENDIIIAVDGHDLRDFNQLPTLIGNKRPTETVLLTITREGATFDLTVTLGSRSEITVADAPTVPSNDQDEVASLENLGLTLSNMTPALREQLGLGEGTAGGVVITDVNPNSEAYREANLRRGDIVIEIDRKPVRNEGEFMSVYTDITPGSTFFVRISRVFQGGETRRIVTALTKPQ